jgi:hypothetical protein
MQAVVDANLEQLTSLGNILTVVTGIGTNTGNLITDFTNLLTDTTQILTDLAALLVDTGQLVTDFASLLTDTSSMVADLTDIANDLSSLPTDFINLLTDTGSLLTILGDVYDELVDVIGDSWLGKIFNELIALALDIATEILDEFISRGLAIMTAIYDELLNYIRSLSFSGVTVGELLDIVDSWLALWWTVAGDIIGFATNFLSLWAQVFLMGLLGVILIWAAATANGDGAIFAERFTYAMTRNINPVAFILDINIPLGLILLGNLFWVILAGYDWQALLDPGLMMTVPLAHFTLGAYEIPDYSDELDVFFDFTQSILDEFFDVFLDILFFDLWDIFVGLLDSDILGVSPALIIFVICGGLAFSILTRGRF